MPIDLRALWGALKLICVMQPLEDNPVGLAQQQLCLQKMDLFFDSW
jgi:hypothetical protein